MKYKKIWKYQPYRTSRREQDYQQVQEFLKSGDPELWKALYESAYEYCIPVRVRDGFLPRAGT